MKPKIIAIVGPIRAGKSTVSRCLANRHGYTLASNSDILRDIAAKLHLPSDRTNLKRIGDAIFSTLGNDTLARFRLAHAKFPTVIDGVRYLEEVATFRRDRSFKLLGVVANDDTRYLRAMALATEGKDTNLTRSEFDDLPKARSEVEVNDLLRQADYVISNDSSIQQLETTLAELIKKWSAVA